MHVQATARGIIGLITSYLALSMDKKMSTFSEIGYYHCFI